MTGTRSAAAIGAALLCLTSCCRKILELTEDRLVVLSMDVAKMGFKRVE